MTEAVFDSWPSLREWRQFRIGMFALLMFVAGFFAELTEIIAVPDLGFDPENYYRYDHAHPPLAFFSKYGLLLVAASFLVALIGLIFDKKKSPSIVVLCAFFPALMFISGRYW
ncbi:MAG: hypothetical protein WA891_04010 [Acidobacteriaceae bacterium]|jgi:hypothetical protein